MYQAEWGAEDPVCRDKGRATALAQAVPLQEWVWRGERERLGPVFILFVAVALTVHEI